MEESEVRIVDHKELTQLTGNRFYKDLFIFLQGFTQLECIDIIKTLKLIVKSVQAGNDFEYCQDIYREHFINRYINRTENADSINFFGYLYHEEIWFRYKVHLFNTEKKYTFELTNYDDYNHTCYIKEIFTHLDNLHDLIPVNYTKYQNISKLVDPLQNKPSISLKKIKEKPPINIIKITDTNLQILLYDFLYKYFEETDRLDLKKIIEGETKKSTNELVFNGQIMELVNVFRQLKDNKKIINSKDHIADWICHNFICNDGKNNLNCIKLTVKTYLSNTEYKDKNVLPKIEMLFQ